MGALAVFLISVINDRDYAGWKAFVAENRTKVIAVLGGTIAAAVIARLALGAASGAMLSSMIVIVVFFYWCMRSPNTGFRPTRL